MTPPQTKATVLVVDDDIGNIEILAAALESDYEVSFATTGPQALELADGLPDLILLDVMLPGTDGYDVCARLKANPKTATIPVIFVTGLQNAEAESKGLALGAMDYVTKPFNPQIVRARVRNHIELKKMHDVVRALAASDGLTGLANRRRFDEVLAVECRRLARTKSPLSLIMLDIDHFKAFNDTYGHVAGDECLRRVGGAVSGSMRRVPDVAARYGGEEFACILPETAAEGAAAVAEHVRWNIAALAIPHEGSSAAGHVTASLGVASVTCLSSTEPSELIKSADACLYRAKGGGRNRVVSDRIQATSTN